MWFVGICVVAALAIAYVVRRCSVLDRTRAVFELAAVAPHIVSSCEGDKAPQLATPSDFARDAALPPPRGAGEVGDAARVRRLVRRTMGESAEHIPPDAPAKDGHDLALFEKELGDYLATKPGDAVVVLGDQDRGTLDSALVTVVEQTKLGDTDTPTYDAAYGGAISTVADPVARISEAWTALRPGGRLVIRTPVLTDDFDETAADTESLALATAALPSRNLWYHRYWRKALEEAGFRVELAKFGGRVSSRPPGDDLDECVTSAVLSAVSGAADWHMLPPHVPRLMRRLVTERAAIAGLERYGGYSHNAVFVAVKPIASAPPKKSKIEASGDPDCVNAAKTDEAIDQK